MRRKKITSTIVFLALFSFLFISTPIIAQGLEVDYPKVGTKTITSETEMPEYINYIFNLAIIIGVIVSIGALIYGGFGYLTSAGDPGKLQDAKDRIFGSLLGLIILLGSYLILNIVNPQLTVVSLENVNLKWGVRLIDDSSGKEELVGRDISNIQETYGENFQPEKIKILENSENQIKVYVYNKENFGIGLEPNSGLETKVYEKTNPNTTLPVDVNFVIKSIRIEGIRLGVYLAKTDEPDSEKVYLPYDIPNLETRDFNDDGKYIEIRNDYDKNTGERKTNFAAILFTDVYYKKEAKVFFEKIDGIGLIPDQSNGVISTKIGTGKMEEASPFGKIIESAADHYRQLPSSAKVFQINPEGSCTVRLYKEPEFKEGPGGQNICEITEAIYEPIFINDYSGDPGGCSDMADEVRSIEINPPGRCLVVLFENKIDGNGNWDYNTPGTHIEVFTKNDPDLSDNWINQTNPNFWDWFIPGHEPGASSIAIYPIK